MELKHGPCNATELRLFTLLIVPYGIETKAYGTMSTDGSFLLIVPYGIETRKADST